MSEAPQKKCKLEADEGWEERLSKEAVEKLQKDRYGFCFLKVLYCNAHKVVSFAEAFVDCKSNVDEPGNTYLLFDCIFKHGFEVIESYIRHKQFPIKKGEEKALELLMEFFTDHVKECEEALKKPWKSETEWTTRLAHHLLSKLAIKPNYIIDNQSRDQVSICLCCKKDISGMFGDTSIGNTQGWHGNMDIFIGVPVQVSQLDSESPDGNESSSDIIKDKQHNRNQAISQTIVFSFLMKKSCPECSGFLVPSIVITSTDAIIYFYDCENDILLESTPLSLFLTSQELDWSTVFALWLTINFRYFCCKTPKKVKELHFQADFLKFVEPFSKIYEDVKMGCGSRERIPILFDPGKMRGLYTMGREDD